MTSQSSGGSGSGLPGVTGDGLTPGGEVIAGAITAGDPNAASVPSFALIHGYMEIDDVPGNQVADLQTLAVYQQADLTRANPTQAILVQRLSTLGAFDFTAPVVDVTDSTASTAPVLRVQKGGATQFQVDGDGVRIHSKLKTGASVTHTASVLSGKCVPIYDEAGTLLGYMPLYN